MTDDGMRALDLLIDYGFAIVFIGALAIQQWVYWRSRAKRVDLALAFRSSFSIGEHDGLIRGIVKGVPLTINPGNSGDAAPQFIVGLENFPPDLTLSHETRGFFDPSSDVQTGDDDFDSRFKLSGPSEHWAALMREPVRRELLFFAKSGTVSVKNSLLHFQLAPAEYPPDTTVQWAEVLGEFVDQLKVSHDGVFERLVAIAAGDHNPGVRLRSLATLGELFATDSATVRLIRAGLQSEHLDLRRTAVALAVLSPDTVLAAEGANAVPRTSAQSVEEGLLAWVAPEENSVFTASVLTAIGRVGSLKILGRVREFSADSRFAHVRAYAVAAAAEIQKRHGSLPEGGVSLVAEVSNDGAVSVASDVGALSLKSRNHS